MNQKNAIKHRSHGMRSGKQDALRPNSEISRKLKAYYAELVADDVPDRFKSLLRELERQKQAGHSAETDR